MHIAAAAAAAATQRNSAEVRVRSAASVTAPFRGPSDTSEGVAWELEGKAAACVLRQHAYKLDEAGIADTAASCSANTVVIS